MLSVTRERGQGAGEETGERAQECQTPTAMLFFKPKKRFITEKRRTRIRNDKTLQKKRHERVD